VGEIVSQKIKSLNFVVLHNGIQKERDDLISKPAVSKLQIDFVTHDRQFAIGIMHVSHRELPTRLDGSYQVLWRDILLRRDTSKCGRGESY
jgi:hypothetical protein